MRRLRPRLSGPRLLAVLALALGGWFASAQAADEAAGDSKPAKAPIGKSVSTGRHTTKTKPAVYPLIPQGRLGLKRPRVAGFEARFDPDSDCPFESVFPSAVF